MNRSARRFTVGDWITRPELLLPPRPIRMTQQQKDTEEITATGRTIWRPVPKDKHILRMYISAGLSVFADVMRPYLEKRLGRLLTTFAETVEEILPYWDALSRESQDAWIHRANDVKVKNHYVYLRIGTQLKQHPKKHKELEVDDYETDPDELPGEVCVQARVIEEKPIKPMNWVTGERHLMPQRMASLH